VRRRQWAVILAPITAVVTQFLFGMRDRLLFS
jgi:hypothetical protein